MRLHPVFFIMHGFILANIFDKSKTGPWNVVILKLVWLLLIVIFRKKLTPCVRHQTAKLNTDYHSDAWSKEKKKPHFPALRLRTKENSYAVEGSENVFASLEMMMKSFLKENFGFNSELRFCLQIGTFYARNFFTFFNNSTALFQVL